MITEEKMNLNYVGFISMLKKYNCYTELLENDVEFNTSLKTASAFLREDSGGAYDGSLIEHIKQVAKYAFNINEMLNESVRASIDSIVRVCYLQQISKALMIVKNDREYDIKNGRLYKFSNNVPSMKCGELSLYLCNKYKIQLTDLEYEAILAVDKPNDEQIKFFGGVLSLIIRTANDLAVSERKYRYENYINTTK